MFCASGGGSSGGSTSSGSGVDNYEPPPYTEPPAASYVYESYTPPVSDPAGNSGFSQDTASDVVSSGGSNTSFEQDTSFSIAAAGSVLAFGSEIAVEGAALVGAAAVAAPIAMGVLGAGVISMAVGIDPIEAIQSTPLVETFPLSDPVPNLIPDGISATPVIDGTYVLPTPLLTRDPQDLVLSFPAPDIGVNVVPPLVTPLDIETAFPILLAAELVSAKDIHFSQNGISASTSGGIMLDDLSQSMANSWRGDPLRVYETPAGELVSVDNRRLAAAKLIDILVPVERISINDPIIDERDGIRNSVKVRRTDNIYINMDGEVFYP